MRGVRVLLAVLLLLAGAGGWTARSAGPAVAEAAPAGDVMGALREELAGLVGGWAGQNAVSVTDLQTGQTVSVNGARPQPAGCTIKIFIMMAIAQDIEAGRYTKADVAALVRDAMGPSNVAPARELIRRAGGGDIGAGIRRINAIMAGLGARGSILTHPPGYPWEEYGYRASHGIVDNLLVADELNLMLGKLYRGEALSRAATDYVLWSMTLAIPGQNASLGGPLPDEATLYHKIGLVYAPYNTWNDAGIVTFARGGRTYAYAISYLGSFGPDWREAYRHGASVSAAAWERLSAHYASAPVVERCFAETDRCVSGIFYRYWRDNGGLAQQGLPLTGRFEEVNPTDGRTYTVQYFERARFELHPEHANTPHVVLLGLLGREQFIARYPGGQPVAAGLAAFAAPAAPRPDARATLLRQLADYDRFRAGAAPGDDADPTLGWRGYDRALERFLMVRPELRAYLLWYYRVVAPGDLPGRAYHPPAAALLAPPSLDRYLAGEAAPDGR